MQFLPFVGTTPVMKRGLSINLFWNSVEILFYSSAETVQVHEYFFKTLNNSPGAVR